MPTRPRAPAGRGTGGIGRPAPSPRSAVLLLQGLAENVAQARAGVRRPILGDGLLLFGDLERLDREVRLLRAVETGHHGIELLTDLETLRTLLVAVAAEVGPLDEASRAVVADLHFEAAVAHFENGDGDRLALVHATAGADGAALRDSATLELLHAEA